MVAAPGARRSRRRHRRPGASFVRLLVLSVPPFAGIGLAGANRV
jgi:hypothetical protein